MRDGAEVVEFKQTFKAYPSLDESKVNNCFINKTKYKPRHFRHFSVIFYSQLSVTFPTIFRQFSDISLQMKWFIEDPSDGATLELAPGTIKGNFEANSVVVQSTNHTYVAILRMKNIRHSEDDDKTIKFIVEVKQNVPNASIYLFENAFLVE